MSHDRIQEVYDGKLFSEETQEELRQRVHWICLQVRGPRVLDVGCSQGTVARLLAAEGLEVVGVDKDHDAIDFATALVAQDPEPVQRRIQLAHGNVLDEALEDQSFDTVIMGQFLEHVARPLPFVEMAHRVLRNDGLIVATTPLGLFPHSDHCQTFYLSDFLSLLAKHFDFRGLEIIGKRICFVGSKKVFDKRANFEDVLPAAKALQLLEREFLLAEEHHTRIQNKFVNDRDRLNQRISTLAEREGNFQKKIASLESKIVSLDRDLAVVTEQRAGLEARLLELRQDFESVQSEVRTKEEQRAGLEAQLLELRQDFESVQSEVRTKEEQRAGLEARLLELRQDFESVQSEVSTEKERRRRVETRQAELEKEVERLRVQRHHDETRSRALKVEAAVLADEVRQARQEVQTLRGSARFRLGTYFALAARPSLDTVRLPGRLLRLALESLKRPPKLGSPPKTPRKDPFRSSGKTVVGAIFDQFSMSCFEPEAHLLTFRPDNWEMTLTEERPKLLFVESAWRGNDGSWQYKIASYTRNMGNELVDLVQYCKAKRIPTVFWNKEDPVHYHRFIEKAKLFDFVFTSDDRCVPRYVSAVGHNRVAPLPFAAQPKIHNPILEQPRHENVCFAGTYYAGRHEQRREDMEYLLKPAMDVGLHIYDRRHGYVGRDADQFRFPKIYQSAIQGRLEYDDMVKAYKRYKCFLNVNSVKDSDTMFSRRVFELLACGTPVISTYSKGIEKLLGDDTVFFTESAGQTRDHLERVLSDQDAWMRASLKGIRRVLNGNTYADRFEQICRGIGVDSFSLSPDLCIIGRCRNSDELVRLVETLKRQVVKPTKTFLLSPEGLSSQAMSAVSEVISKPHSCSVYVDNRKGQEACFLELKKNVASWVAFMKLEASYGVHYLEDLSLAALYSPSPIIGKHTFFRAQGARGGLELKNVGREFQLVTGIQCSTAAALVTRLEFPVFRRLLEYKWFKSEESSILSLHRFGFVEGTSDQSIQELSEAALKVLDS